MKKDGQRRHKGHLFWCFLGYVLDMVIFLKLMTVSNGMLTFARSGVPKMLPKIDKNWCQKTIPSSDEFFTKKCSHRLPKVLQKWIITLASRVRRPDGGGGQFLFGRGVNLLPGALWVSPILTSRGAPKRGSGGSAKIKKHLF